MKMFKMQVKLWVEFTKTSISYTDLNTNYTKVKWTNFLKKRTPLNTFVVYFISTCTRKANLRLLWADVDLCYNLSQYLTLSVWGRPHPSNETPPTFYTTFIKWKGEYKTAKICDFCMQEFPHCVVLLLNVCPFTFKLPQTAFFYIKLLSLIIILGCYYTMILPRLFSPALQFSAK